MRDEDSGVQNGWMQSDLPQVSWLSDTAGMKVPPLCLSLVLVFHNQQAIRIDTAWRSCCTSLAQAPWGWAQPSATFCPVSPAFPPDPSPWADSLGPTEYVASQAAHPGSFLPLLRPPAQLLGKAGSHSPGEGASLGGRT